MYSLGILRTTNQCSPVSFGIVMKLTQWLTSGTSHTHVDHAHVSNHKCFCGVGSDYSRHGTSSGCTLMCEANPNELCGGDLAIEVRGAQHYFWLVVVSGPRFGI